jgi:hypothetical protein
MVGWEDASVRWELIVPLAFLALARPLLSIAGAYETLGGGALGPLLVTALLAVVWVATVVLTRAPKPLVTLLLVGALYGLLAIALQQLLWNLSPGGVPEEAPSSTPVLVVSWASILATNAIWGALLGLVAAGIRRLVERRPLG